MVCRAWLVGVLVVLFTPLFGITGEHPGCDDAVAWICQKPETVDPKQLSTKFEEIRVLALQALAAKETYFKQLLSNVDVKSVQQVREALNDVYGKPDLWRKFFAQVETTTWGLLADVFSEADLQALRTRIISAYLDEISRQSKLATQSKMMKKSLEITQVVSPYHHMLVMESVYGDRPTSDGEIAEICGLDGLQGNALNFKLRVETPNGKMITNGTHIAICTGKLVELLVAKSAKSALKFFLAHELGHELYSVESFEGIYFKDKTALIENYAPLYEPIAACYRKNYQTELAAFTPDPLGLVEDPGIELTKILKRPVDVVDLHLSELNADQWAARIAAKLFDSPQEIREVFADACGSSGRLDEGLHPKWTLRAELYFAASSTRKILDCHQAPKRPFCDF